MQFYDQWGRFPADGVDLLCLENDSMIGEDGPAKLQALPKHEQVIRFYRSINPATGRFFTTYTAEEWEPFGMCVSTYSGDDEFGILPGGSIDPKTGETVHQFNKVRFYHVVIYGEEPGSVILDKEIASIVGFADEADGNLLIASVNRVKSNRPQP